MGDVQGMHRFERGGRPNRLPFVVVTAICVLLLAVDLVHMGGGLIRHVSADVSWTLAAAFVCLACGRCTWRSEGRDRRVWLYFLGGCGFWLAGQLAWDQFDLFGSFPPSPSAADVGFLGFAVLFVAGLLTLVRVSRVAAALLTLDIAMLAGALAVLFLSLLWSHIAVSPLSTPARVTTLLYPVLFGTLFGSLVVLPLRGRHTFSVRLLLAGVGCEVVAFFLWTPALLDNNFAPGSWLDALWTVGLLCIAWAADEFDAFAQIEAEDQLFGPAALVPLALAVGAVVARAWDFHAGLLGHAAEGLLVGLTAGLVVLTALRLGLTLQQCRALVRRVQSGSRALAESEERFRAIFDGAPIGIEIADMQGRLTATNAALQTMLGYTGEELNGLPYTEITFPEDIALEASLDDELVAGARDSYQIEKRHVHKDGHAVWTRLTASEARDELGRPRFAIGMVEDITERKAAEDAVRERERELRAITETATDAIISVDSRGTIISANAATERIFGYPPHSLTGTNIALLMPPRLRHTQWQTLRRRMRMRETAHPLAALELIGVTRSGKEVPLEATFAQYMRRGRRVFAGFVRDITDRERAKAALVHEATHDALTGLPNRVLLRERLARALEGGEQCALLLMDFDRFKEINDTFGHDYGDAVLQQVTARLVDLLREGDTVARLGGDEFAVVLPMGAQDQAMAVARKIADVVACPLTVQDHLLHIDTSIGIAVYPEHGEDVSTLLRHADVAMYAAKRAGTRLTLYEAGQDRHTQRRVMLVDELRKAIEEGQLSLHYQPIARCAGGQVEGVEALTRWRHPVHGLIMPAEFIPLAEQTGLIKPLTWWLIGESLSQWRRWHDQGLDLAVHINLSAHSIYDPDLIDTLSSALAEHRVPAGTLTVELTESVVMEDAFRAREVLQELSDRGVAISVDDFGTGYSSLAYLKQLPVRTIKIDKSFVMHMTVDLSDCSIVRATISLGHDLGLGVVAEGVESDEAWHLLDKFGCDMVQGYGLTRPLPADELVEWLRSRHRTVTNIRRLHA